MKFIKDLGMQYPTENSKRKKRYGLYECPICMKNIKMGTHDSKKAKSCKPCGATKHGKTNTRIYRTWAGMKSRCLNKNDTGYKRYGACGIGICDEWIESFESFNEWAINNGYSKLLTIDRINPYKDYYPDNCRFSNKNIQAHNNKTNKIQ